MTRVDFYVMEMSNERQHDNLVCRLAEKAWSAGNRVHIRCENDASAESIDNLLWSYKDTSFVPHAKIEKTESEAAPITIGVVTDVPKTTEVLINLGPDVPDFFSRFDRVMETTGSNDDTRSAARERYRYYQERGYALKTHKLGSVRG